MSWSVDHGSPAGGGPEVPENLDDILVFGYGCKLFRDDEKAAFIENEEHLIPWMGDPNLKIDRYDGRGALMDLRPFISPSEGQEPGLSNVEENELESLLEEERYKDLREDNEYDDQDYQEVEFRKFQSDVNGVVGQGQYAAIGYSYDEVGNNSTAVYPKPKAIDEDLPYVKPLGLIIPDDIILPATIKLHAIIEKTAKFIASNGNQMEIILKTKQSGNQLFNFLGYTDSLNPYYKFLVQEIRSNNYKPEEELPESELNSASQEECSGSEDESSYLHPSLFGSSTSVANPPVSKITYKHPSGPTAYSMLVSKIKGSNPDPVSLQTTADSYNYYYDQDASTGYGWVDPSATSDQSTNLSLDPSETPTRPQSQVPAQQDQLVIEKMASYVVKNGYAFEELARTKGDPRFVFLHPSHEYHWYYLNCKERFRAETSSVVASGNFVSYSESASSNSTITVTNTNSSLTGNQPTKIIKNLEVRRITPQQKVPSITLQSISLPLSASGIPIANHASISSRPTTIPPEVASRIEEIKKKNTLFGKKEQSNILEVKKDKLKIQFSSAISKNMSLGTEIASPLTEETLSTANSVVPNEGETQPNDSNFTQSIDPLKQCDENSTGVKALDRLSNGSQSQVIVDEEDAEEKERKRKVERRRKAALFLQRIQLKTQNLDEDSSKSEIETLSSNNNELDKNGVDGGTVSDVESIPETAVVEVVREDLKENDIRVSDPINERLWDESNSRVIETDKISKNGSNSRSESRLVSRSRSRSRGHSVKSRRKSLSVSSDTSTDSALSRRKRSKRKHSKKRKKKHDKDRSNSRNHSKKSKRHKH